LVTLENPWLHLPYVGSTHSSRGSKWMLDVVPRDPLWCFFFLHCCILLRIGVRLLIIMMDSSTGTLVNLVEMLALIIMYFIYSCHWLDKCEHE